MKLQVNDRVKVFGNAKNGEPLSGLVMRVNGIMGGPDGWISVTDLGFNYTVHEKQVRKLKPKRKPREWWIDDEDWGVYDEDTGGCIHVREVLEKKEKK